MTKAHNIDFDMMKRFNLDNGLVWNDTRMST